MTGLILTRQSHTIAHALMFVENSLNLSQLNPETPDLNLMINTAEEIESSV